MRIKLESPGAIEDQATGTFPSAFDLCMCSDVGTKRSANEDSCSQLIEGSTRAIFAIADGVGGNEGGEIASSMAVEVTLSAWREGPASWSPGKRLHRAVQRANIEIYNRALVVPELHRMASTLTAAAVIDGTLYIAHVGDCRLYLVRDGCIQQLTKDHTVVAERARLGLMSSARARRHPERSTLSRCLGRELIVSIDRITTPLRQRDRIILCSDGLYNVLDDWELEHLSRGMDAASACRVLIDNANQRGSADNITAAIFLMNGSTTDAPRVALHTTIARVFLSLVRRSPASPRC
jgi:serine/threonine protein phosphatase PrpC